MKKLFLLSCLFLSTFAKADIVNEMVQVSCMQELYTIEISLQNYNGEDAMQSIEKNYKKIYKKYNLFPIDKLFTIEDFYITKTFELNKTCSIGKDIYKIKILPYIENSNIQGQCGMFRSIILTLTQNGKPLIKDFVYQECAPSEISITSVKLSDDYIIMGKKLIFLNDAKSLPITNENFSKLEDFFD